VTNKCEQLKSPTRTYSSIRTTEKTEMHEIMVRVLCKVQEKICWAIKNEDFTYEYVQLRQIRQNLYIKEKYNISNEDYHEFQ